MAISNKDLLNHKFLAGMYSDGYFPPFLVDKSKAILVRLCESIEKQQPKDASALCVLTHAATEEFNRLAEEFEENDSEIETAAREVIAGDFDTIAKAYGFDVDVEELIAPRDW